jgi:hypothetical protein
VQFSNEQNVRNEQLNMEKENPFAAPQSNPVPPHQSMQVTPTSGLTNGELVFLVFCILGAAFIALCIFSFHFVILPTGDDVNGEDTVDLFFYLVAVLWVALLGIVVTVFIIFYKKSLALFPTLLLCGALFIGCYTIPLAIWGVVLLITRQSRMNA